MAYAEIYSVLKNYPYWRIKAIFKVDSVAYKSCCLVPICFNIYNHHIQVRNVFMNVLINCYVLLIIVLSLCVVMILVFCKNIWKQIIQCGPNAIENSLFYLLIYCIINKESTYIPDEECVLLLLLYGNTWFGPSIFMT